MTDCLRIQLYSGVGLKTIERFYRGEPQRSTTRFALMRAHWDLKLPIPEAQRVFAIGPDAASRAPNAAAPAAAHAPAAPTPKRPRGRPRKQVAGGAA